MSNSTTLSPRPQALGAATNPQSDGQWIRRVARTLLKTSAVYWVATVCVGQWMFVAYIVAAYGLADAASPASGESTALGAHVAMAAIIMLAGTLQLIPQIRNRFRRFHRWNGRTFVVGSCVASLVGLYMVWVHGTVGSTLQHLGVSLDGLLILLFSALAVRYARQRDFKSHQQWALRLFMVVSAVWFFRVGLQMWMLLTGGPTGFDPQTFDGPFLDVLGFAQYLLPLAVLELYLRASNGQRGNDAGSLWARPSVQIAVAAVIVIGTTLMIVGIYGATTRMWLPRLL